MHASEEYQQLIRDYRQQCLWFLSPGVVPESRDAQLHTLECIERYGSMAAFVQARRLKEWLLQNSSDAFVVS